jgi:catechol 2,3-dioxygenase-like lactoylglutathione lyase family enzyme
VSLGVRDLARGAAFYEVVLAEIGFEKLVSRAETVGFGKRYPEFWLNARPGMGMVPAESGTHVCLRTREKAQVDAFHQAAIAAGAVSDGAPGPRPDYGEGYYAAFIRDADGNRVEVVTFLID